MSMALGSRLQLTPGSWAETIYQVCIGAVVGVMHLYIQIKNTLGMQHESTMNPDKALKVVGLGYGRTGTYSLKLAFEELGFPTLHTQHLSEHKEIMNMWTNDVILPSIRAEKVHMGSPDLPLIAGKFQATVDFPVAFYFQDILELYPDCKFILTQRESSEEWFQSWNAMTGAAAGPMRIAGLMFSSVKPYSNYWRWLYALVNKDDSILTMPLPLPEQNKTASIKSYEDHNFLVQATVPADRLLLYKVKEGWAPLCSFLEISDCPETPFPKTNSARSVRIQAVVAVTWPVLCLCFLLYFAMTIVLRRRMAGKRQGTRVVSGEAKYSLCYSKWTTKRDHTD